MTQVLIMRLQSLMACSLLGFLMASHPVLAQQNFTVTFKGKLKQSTCTPNIQRELVPSSYVSGNTVDFGWVSTDQLNAAGAIAASGRVTFRASGCTGNINNMWIYFSSANVDAGRIVPNNSSQLRFEIRNGSSSGDLVWVNWGGSNTQPDAWQGTAEPFSGSHPTDSHRVATKRYQIRVYAKQAVTVAQTYSATVTANFKYY